MYTNYKRETRGKSGKGSHANVVYIAFTASNIIFGADAGIATYVNAIQRGNTL